MRCLFISILGMLGAMPSSAFPAGAEAPVSLEATALHLTRAYVSWKKEEGSGPYLLELNSADDQSEVRTPIQVDAAHFVLENLTPGTRYGAMLKKGTSTVAVQNAFFRTPGYCPKRFGNETLVWGHSLRFNGEEIPSVLFFSKASPTESVWKSDEKGVVAVVGDSGRYDSLNAQLYSALPNYTVEVELTFLNKEGGGAGLHLGGHRSAAWDHWGRNHLIVDPRNDKMILGSVVRDQNKIDQVSASRDFPVEVGKTYRLKIIWDDLDHRIKVLVDGEERLVGNYAVVGNPIWSTGMVRLGSTPVRFSRFEIKAYLPTNRDGSPRDIAAQGDSITHGRLWVTNFEANLGKRIAALGISLDTGLNMWTQERFQLDLACLSLKKIILFHGANDLSIGGNFKESSPQVDKTLELTRKMAVYALEKGVTPVLAETLPRSDAKKGETPIGRASNSAYNQKLRALAAELKIQVLTWNRTLLDPESPHGMMPGMHDGGWIHPNPEGAKRMMSALDFSVFFD